MTTYAPLCPHDDYLDDEDWLSWQDDYATGPVVRAGGIECPVCRVRFETLTITRGPA